MAMPTPVAIADLITDLIGRDVTAKTTPPSPLAAKGRTVAVYRDAEHMLKAAVCCDLAVGGSFGAAMTVMPVGLVDDSVKAGKLEAGLSENLYEVFNVLSAIFPKAGMPRLILRGVHADGNVDPEVAVLLAKPPDRIDMDVSVAGYRPGKMSFAVL